jgi:hypothetical protein
MESGQEGGSPPALAPPSAPPAAAAAGFEHPVLRATRPLAALGLVALLTGRVLAPALEHVGVASRALVLAVGLAGAVTTQVFAVAAMMIAILSVLAASRSRLPFGVRVAALVIGSFAVLPTLWALHEPVPDLSAALVAASASLLALLATPTALRAPFARAPGLVIGLVALGGLVRLGAVALAYQSAGESHRHLAAVAATIAMVAFFCDAAAIAVALAWVSTRGKTLTNPATLTVLALALVCTRLALGGQSNYGNGVELLFWRAASHLLSRPDAALPLALRVFVSFLAPLVAIAALFARGTLVPLGAGVALALAARGAVEMPPCALMLLIGALAAAFTASDARALWASLARSVPVSSHPTHPSESKRSS